MEIDVLLGRVASKASVLVLMGKEEMVRVEEVSSVFDDMYGSRV